MNELITITEKDGKQLVDARELHEFLEVATKFPVWFQNRIEKYEFVKNQDYVILSKNLEKIPKGRPSIDYALTLDMAKELCMVENNEKGRQARKYFIEIEKRYKNQELANLLDNPLPYIKTLINYSEQLQIKNTELEEENKKLLPKAKTWEFVSQEGNCITFTTLAKMIPAIETAARLKQLLKNWNYIFSNGTVARKGYEQYYRPYIGKDKKPSLNGNLGITPAGVEFTLDRLEKKHYISMKRRRELESSLREELAEVI